MAIWRVTLSGELYGVEKWANVFHVDKAPATDIVDVMDAFETWYSAPAAGMAVLTPCCGNAFGGIIGVKLSAISAQAVVTPAPPVLNLVNHNGGQNSAGGLPCDVSVVLSWQTALAGKSFRGRTYFPPWHENQNDDTGGVMPRPATASLTGIATSARELLDALIVLDAPLVVWSRTLSVGTPVTGGYLDSGWDTQRRRTMSQPVARIPLL